MSGMHDLGHRSTLPSMRVLHIANWYPHPDAPHEAPFVQRHVAALRPYGDQVVWHIAVRPGRAWSWVRSGGPADRTSILNVRTKKWHAIEWLTLLLVVHAWITRDRSARFDAIVLVIAYPLAVHWRILRRLFGVPVLISEHWSAYHSDFRSTSPGLERTRRIFTPDLPVVCVSNALGNDIARFARRNDLDLRIIPNIVDTTRFHPERDTRPIAGRFFAISGWRRPKRPETLVLAMERLCEMGLDVHLTIAGDGPLMPEIRALVEAHGLGQRIDLPGRLGPERAARGMREAHAFLHCSDYETYSVVCAEALCCGTPVFASAVGGIPEFVHAGNGMLLPDNAPETWALRIREDWDRALGMDRKEIAGAMMARSSAASVGERYAQVIQSCIGDRRP